MKNTLKSILITAAMSGMLAGGVQAQQNGSGQSDQKSQPKAEKNSCGGKNGCGNQADKKASGKDSKDKNSCSASKGKDKNSCSANKGSNSQKPPSA